MHSPHSTIWQLSVYEWLISCVDNSTMYSLDAFTTQYHLAIFTRTGKVPFSFITVWMIFHDQSTGVFINCQYILCVFIYHVLLQYIAKHNYSILINSLTEGGQTALGPALMLSVAMAAQKVGSKVIVCTDGLANVGLGRLDVEDDEHYDKASVFYEYVGHYGRDSG